MSPGQGLVENLLGNLHDVCVSSTALQLRELAASYLQEGRYGEAIMQLERSDELEPSHSTTLVDLARAYWLNGMPGEAIVVAKRADERWGRFYELLSEGR